MDIARIILAGIIAKGIKYMNITKAFETIANAMTTMDKNGETIKVYKNDLPETIKDSLINIQYQMSDDTGASFELSYEIMDDALTAISDAGIDELDSENWENEPSSVYTAERLAYMNLNNQQAISDIMREFSTDDISTACAVWYDNAVRDTISEVIKYIKTFEE